MHITKETFISQFETIYRLEDRIKDALKKGMKSRTVTARKNLVSLYHQAIGIYCLQRGSITFGYNINGRLKLRWHVRKGDLCIPYMSLFLLRPTIEEIRVIPGTKFLFLPFTVIEALCPDEDGLYFAILNAGLRKHTGHLQEINAMPDKKMALYFRHFMPWSLKYQNMVAGHNIKLAKRNLAIVNKLRSQAFATIESEIKASGDKASDLTTGYKKVRVHNAHYKIFFNRKMIGRLSYGRHCKWTGSLLKPERLVCFQQLSNQDAYRALVQQHKKELVNRHLTMTRNL